MRIKTMNRTIPISRLLWFILGIAVGIQLIIITYNHLSGYYVLDDFRHFTLRLMRGTLLSVAAGLMIVFGNLLVIAFLNQKTSWEEKPLLRIPIQFLLTILLASLVSLGITSLAHAINPYREGLSPVLLTNALIYSVVNLVIMTVLEAWIYFIEGSKARVEAKKLREELSQIKFEVLKSQINPHFMFNSLNVLSGLISTDVNKAQIFIDEFSHIYRYVLETIEQPVSTLERELDFMRSYLFLQQIRYGESLTYSVDIPADLLEKLLPPLSLQVVLENAIKHNVVNAKNPLNIDIFTSGQTLIVKNTLKPKMTMGKSTGVGLKNLKKRYALVGTESPVFNVDSNHYIARLPLIENH
jgi:hypothetical protein